MHLAAAVGTPVVAVFAATVPASRWRPWGVRHRLLGDSVDPEAVFDAVHELVDDEPAVVGSRR
jgi:ADP-heptose:LPS heptosyltransferase